MLSAEQRTLRHVASRLQAVVRQRTRLINQFHLLLTSTFPELALLAKDIARGWVLTLCERYPTATLLAAASAHDLGQIPFLPEKLIAPLLEHARTAIASLDGDTVAELGRAPPSAVTAPIPAARRPARVAATPPTPMYAPAARRRPFLPAGVKFFRFPCAWWYPSILNR
jgi:hypothetical protein